MIQRLKDCWLILTGKGSVRIYDDDPCDPWCPCFEPDLNDQTIEEIAESIEGS